ncbi:MAG: hypothetical protein KF752_13710 [Pirellulaceae bacterium]|nr:hypothetical protein [Pirellulaceae bacterium]
MMQIAVLRFCSQPQICILTVILALSGQSASTRAPLAQEPSARTAPDNNSAPQLLDTAQMRAELLRLRVQCERLGLTGEAEICLTWLAADRPDQQVYCLPINPESDPIASQAQQPQTARWQEHFTAARKGHARYLFALAQQQAAAGDERQAFRLLWRVLKEDPDHAPARRVLGPLSSALTARPQQRPTTKQSAELSSANPFQRYQTRHFQLLSRADAKLTSQMATQLEQFYAIWCQCFYEYWAPPGLLKARLEGSNPPWPQPPRMEVVLLSDRTEYLRVLGIAESRIEVSVGYYNPYRRRCYFYPSEQLSETLQHELTHQLFAQASRLALNGDQENLAGGWIIEGIALYMESLDKRPFDWTVGGIQSRRLQTARYRALRDQHWPSWTEFCQSTLAQWKHAPDISLNYAHAAGLVHLYLDLMDDQPASRDAILRYLAGVYASAAQPADLLQILGQDESAAQVRYRQLMTITDEQLSDLVASRQPISQLVLSRSQLVDWSIIGSFTQLQWLDMSFSNWSPTQAALSQLMRLERLSLEGTAIDESALKIIASLPQLKELDVSLCAIDDQALLALRNHPRLETLWLTGTRVTNRGLETLATLPSLRYCNIDSTAVNETEWNAFLQKNPQISAN